MTTPTSQPVNYRFSFGPWNISEGADPFGPDTREPLSFAKKLPLYKSLGIDGVQFHDDDAVPGMDDMSPSQIIAKAKEVKAQIEDHGLVAEFVAPRMWFSPHTIDGGYTSNSAADRKYALDRSYRTIDIMNAMGTSKGASATQHLSNSRAFFLTLVEKVRALDRAQEQAFIEERDYEGLECYIVNHLMGTC